ncbi:Flagellar hook-associated protein FliD [hydrothermal vent metagenome]|uniref:Filament cap protein n=1 Tax=hydrothermal vent metagenome TaxID=652676 RepID=A0A1W1D2U5_9ZZZZ
MGVSSLGMGSNILTQDVLDKLRQADEASRLTPIKRNLSRETEKKNTLDFVKAHMKNLSDSIDELKSHTLYDERKTQVSGDAVSVSAQSNTDIQDFTLDVTQLATKEIVESGSFSSNDAKIASGSGSLTLSVDGEDFSLDYDENTTLQDLKKMINDTAGDKVDATVVQIGDDDFRLFISSVGTGSNQNITLKDNDDNLDTKLTDDMQEIQEGKDAKFTFNGEDVTRHSNQVDDLITGLDITLNQVGTSHVSVEQDREEIMKRLNSFVQKYNDAMSELKKDTKSSQNSEERGAFSGDSTINNLKRSLEDIVNSLGEGAGSMMDYGFDIDKDGVLSLDTTKMRAKLDENPSNVEAFLSGGDFVKEDGTTVQVKGVFTQIANTVDEYTDYNGTLDRYATSIDNRISELRDREDATSKRLDEKYEIMKKQFAAYDAMINKLNSTSEMFKQMVAQANAKQ